VRGILAMAKALHLSVTGEGVETATQSRHLREAGCDRGQGYLFARPLPAADVARLLVSGNSPHELAAA